jgi:glycosyltransferase involved in cell wall biosynthesis
MPSKTKPLRPGLSAIVLTQNSGATLDACLSSLAFCDEILVVDSGSSDASLRIARAHGARVRHQPWLGYTRQRNAALAWAQHAWVLSVDSDEVVPGALALEIRLALSQPTPHAGFYIPERVRFFRRWLRWGGIYPGYHLTLFRRDRVRYGHGPADVHEGPILQGSSGRLRNFKLHHAYPSFRLALRKLNRYTSLEAQGRWQKGKRATLYGIFWRPLERFLKNYFLKLGFLDGWEGFLYCYLTAHYAFVTHIKLYEQEKNGSIA